MPRLPFFEASEKTAFGDSPLSSQLYTPMSCGSSVSPFAARVMTVFSEEGMCSLISVSAVSSEEEIQGAGALLVGRYRPGSDWLPDLFPYNPPSDMVVG